MRQRMTRFYVSHREDVLMSSVGIFVMLLSYVELWFMEAVLGWSSWVAYPIQIVISVELNFLLNHFVTYKHVRRNTTFLRAIMWFHVTRITFTIPLNMLLYPLLSDGVFPALFTAFLPASTWLLEYVFIAAQTICLGITFVVNRYVYRFIYRERSEKSVSPKNPYS